jgi:hypothetical protein
MQEEGERRRHRSSAARRNEGVLQCQYTTGREREFSRKADVRASWAKGSRRIFFRTSLSGLRSASGFQNSDTYVVKTEKKHKEA